MVGVGRAREEGHIVQTWKQELPLGGGEEFLEKGGCGLGKCSKGFVLVLIFMFSGEVDFPHRFM